MSRSFFYRNQQHAVDLGMLGERTRENYEQVFRAGWVSHKATAEMEEDELWDKRKGAVLLMAVSAFMLGIVIGVMV